ncbi:2-methylcitrate dehydratase [Pandoraea anhela]|uniref:2-methylcitrate dehydratase n=2 Tax=Pandoraea anhela TaxID=2508295 RepID=A0A5E4WJG5_9BURK|nr:2-methylcitrate dehydratase [Pandoraea anhela]
MTLGPKEPTFRGKAMVEFCLDVRRLTFDDAVLDMVRRTFLDYLGCTLSGSNDPSTVAVRKTVSSWGVAGRASVLGAFDTLPALAALVNATAAHSQDLDDTLPKGAGHPSGPCWSAAIAVAQQEGSDAKTMVAAYIAGFEIMARLGGGGPDGVGRNLQRVGYHPTAVVGRVGATAIGSVLYNLDHVQTANAFGAVATTFSGFQSSHGTDAKPFHVGKAAMDGIIAAQLASHGLSANTGFYEREGENWLAMLIQDGRIGEIPPMSDLGHEWHMFGNAFKLYASCRATHASSEGAMQLREQLKHKKITSVVARTASNVLAMAGFRDPKTPTEARFSIYFCVAMALAGYKLGPEDFSPETLQDPLVRAILPTIQIEPSKDIPYREAFLTVTTDDGAVYRSHIPARKGDPENPLSWDELEQKFASLTTPRYGTFVSRELAYLARRIDEDGALKEVVRLLQGSGRQPASTQPPLSQ